MYYAYDSGDRGPFYKCPNLTEVTLEEGMTKTAPRLLQDCVNLTKVNWPESLTALGSDTFRNCTGLNELDLPSTVKEIGNYAYANCTGLTEITLPDSVTKIGNFAFDGCSSLAEADLPSGLEELDGCAFRNCTSLTKITIPASLTKMYYAYDSGDRGPFYKCTGLTEVTFADGLQTIPTRLLQDCTGLEIVHIPASVGSIAGYAFSNCTSLDAVVYPGSEEEWNRITIGGNNEPLGDATFYFNGEEPQTMDKPKEPVLTAETAGHKAVRLTWTYDGDATLLSSYVLYRSLDGESFSSIRALNGTEAEYTDRVPFNGSARTVYYRIKVFDKYGRSNISADVSAVAASTDTEKPVAVMSPSQLRYAVTGDEYYFSGGLSTDNDSIASYSWNFGDGTTASGIKVKHTFTGTGNRKVTLMVTDVNGLSSSVSQTVQVIDLSQNSEYTKLSLTVCNAADKKTISNVQIVIKGEDYEDTVTAPDGTLQYILPNGDYTLGILADRYISRTVKINAAGGTQEHVIGLTSGNILSGSISVTEMTYEEIQKAGIDVNAPGNEHVYKFKTELTFVAGPKQYQFPIEVIKNNNNQVIQGAGHSFNPSYTEHGEYHDLPTIRIYPITEKFVLVIYGEAHWLKEMYKVELFVNNDSQTDTIEQLTAQLVLPEGLSLADMTSGAQSAEQQLGTLGYNEKTNAVWYIRGDKEGEYNLTALVHGVSMPYGEYIDAEFTTSSPVRVYAGSALHMTITCPDIAERGEDYTVKYRLENVSDKSLYNLSFGITGSEQYKVIGYGDKEAWLPIDSCEYGEGWSHKVEELAPGGYIELALTTTIWFNSALELAQLIPKVGGFIDIAYYLTDVSVVTMEGSTTEIPYDIVVERTERDYLIDKVVDVLVEEFLDKEGIEIPGSLGETMIELVGEGLEMNSTLVSTGKTLLKLQKGETDHTLEISVDDGRGAEDSIYNDHLSITAGSKSEAIIDTVNGTKLEVTGSEVSITAKGPGSTKLKIGVKNSIGAQEQEYVYDIVVTDHDLGASLTLTPDSVTGKYHIDENKFSAAIKAEHDKELKTYKENPFQLVQPAFTIDTSGQTSDSRYSVVLKSASLNDLMDRTTVGSVELKGGTGNLTFSRETLETITTAEGEIEITAERLEEPGLSDDGTWNAYYKFTVQTEEGEVTDFDGHAVEVEVPFEIPSNVTDPVILVDHIKDDGSVETLDGTYDTSNGVVRFATTGFSKFRVYVDPASMPVVQKPIEDAVVTGIVSMPYSGSSVRQNITVRYGETELKEGTDYTVGYSDNVKPGKATVTITGTGSYSGSVTKTFYILPGKTTRGDMFNLANNVKVTWKEVPGAKYYKVYREGVTDKKESQKDPVIVTTGLVGWDKSPGLTNGHAYRYKIVASLTGKGDSGGDSKLSYSKLMYRLKTVVIRSVKNTAPGKVTVKYDKSTSGDSYVLQYCERQDMVGAKTKVVLGANNTSYVIGGLKKGKTYYISIRVRKKVNGIDYYTTFGVPKKVTISK